MAQGRFGVFLVDEGWVDESQLEQALRLQRRFQGMPLGEVLVELGFVEAQALAAHLQAHLSGLHTEGRKRQRFGEFLVEQGAIQSWQLTQGLRYQRALRSLRVGELLVELGHMTLNELDDALERRMHAMVA